MNSETQALIATLEWMIENEKLHRAFDDPLVYPEGYEREWSPEMKLAMQQLKTDDLKCRDQGWLE